MTVTIQPGASSRTTDAFGTNPLVIQRGTTVTWTNNDTVPHTVTSQPDRSTFDSGTLAPGATFSHTFEDAGTFNYFCEIHPQMVGAIQVQ